MSALYRILFGVAALIVLTLTGTLGYMFVAEMQPLDALYMTVITLSSVGYGEVVPLGPGGQVFTIALIVVGIGTAFYTMAAIAAFLIEGHLQDIIGRRSMKSRIAALRNHVIVCGFGRLGRMVAQELASARMPFVVIELSPKLEDKLRELDYPYLIGSGLSDAVLEQAGVGCAKAIVVASASDSDNVFMALSAREVNPSIVVHARGETETGIRRLHLTGVDQVVSPHRLAGQRIANAIVRPAVVDFIELALPGTGTEIDLEEVLIAEECTLKDMRVGDLPGSKVEVSVVAIRRPDATTKLSPGHSEVLQSGDRIVVVGDRGNLERLADLASS